VFNFPVPSAAVVDCDDSYDISLSVTTGNFYMSYIFMVKIMIKARNVASWPRTRNIVS
jgi:hypothetical protein